MTEPNDKRHMVDEYGWCQQCGGPGEVSRVDLESGAPVLAGPPTLIPVETASADVYLSTEMSQTMADRLRVGVLLPEFPTFTAPRGGLRYRWDAEDVSEPEDGSTLSQLVAREQPSTPHPYLQGAGLDLQPATGGVIPRTGGRETFWLDGPCVVTADSGSWASTLANTTLSHTETTPVVTLADLRRAADRASSVTRAVIFELLELFDGLDS